MKSKRVLAALLAGAMAVGCGACAGSGPSESPSSSAQESESASSAPAPEQEASGEQLEIRFTWWGDTKRHDVYNGVCDEFEKAYPEIKVIREANSWNDYWDKLATQVGGGNAPDVVGMHPQYASDYAGRGALADLQPFMDDGTIETDKIPEAVLEGGRVGGLMCMVSQGVTLTSYVVNDNMMQELGVAYPADKGDWTWEELAAIAAEFREKAKASGHNDWYFMSPPDGDFMNFRYWVREHQENDAYSDAGDFTAELSTIESWFQYWKDLRDADLIPDAATCTENDSKALEQKMFTVGQTACMLFPVNQLWLYQAQMEGVKLVPMRVCNNAGKQGLMIEGAHNSVSSAADAAHQKAGAQFINFFTNRPEALELLKMEQGIPANTDMAEHIKPLLDAPNQAAMEFVSASMPMATPYTYAPKGANEIATNFKDAAALVSYGEQSPADAAAQYLAQSQSICEKNKA